METSIFLSKYNPNNLDDIIGQKNIVSILKGYINNKNIPHLLFAGLPGIGKTTAATVIAKELFGDNWESNTIMMNASDERGIDVVRNKIKQATKFAPMGAPFKIIFLDEFDEMCLVKGTKVIIGYNTNKKICNIEDVPKDKYISICSLNIDTNKIEKDKGICINTGISNIYEITLEDGRSIKCTDKHPFFILNDNNEIIKKPLNELSDGDEIIDYSDEIINQCEICNEYTTNERFCSMKCKDIGHSKDMSGSSNPIYGKDAWNKNKTKYDDDRIALQGCFGNSNCSKRPEIKLKVKELLKKFYNTNKGKKVRIKTGKKISNSKFGKTYEEIYKDPELRRKQSSSTYRETGIFIDSNYRRYLPKTDFVKCECCHNMIKSYGNDGIYVHHIDGNHQNNNRKNLMFVCPKCHNIIHDCQNRFIQKGWDITHQKRL